MISHEEYYRDFTVVTVTCTGSSHIKNNKENQDAVGYYFCGEDFIIAVADGVGSCIYATEGSKYAVDAAIDVYKDIYDQDSVNEKEISQKLIDNWRIRIGEGIINEYCSTLKIAMKLKDKIFLFSIGDGLAIVATKNKFLISPKDEGNFANVTECLNNKVTAKNIWFGNIDITNEVKYVVLLCSDGISSGLKNDSEIALANEISNNIDSSKLKNELEIFIADISDYIADDKTIGVIKYEKQNGEP